MNGSGDEWWQGPASDILATAPRVEEPVRPVVAPAPKPIEPEEPERVTGAEGDERKPDRRRSLIIGAAGAAIVGAIVFASIPDDAPTSPSGATTTASPEAFLPPAGDDPEEEVESGSGGDIAPAKPKEKKASAVQTVTLSMRSAGHGDIGVLVKVRIHNGTNDMITVMSSMMKGDNRSAVVGEGTLAPGSRRIEPGETAEGTVEFVTKKPPSQIVLLDPSGQVVAAS